MNKKTYCNPVPFPHFPKGADEELLGMKDSDREYCSLSDPDGLYYDGKYIIYTSYGGAYSSADLMNWRSHKLEGINRTYYAPAVLEIDGKFYFTANNTELYVADKPFGEFKALGYFKPPSGEELVLEDPDLFMDDDGRIYIFWGCGAEVGILGAELDRNNLVQMLCEPKRLIKFNPEHIWERWGEYNQDSTVGWTEGTCMIKMNGRYYLNYSGCGTTFGGYATGVYYSDISPLEGFVYQKNNPVISKRHGLVRGGGHSCIVKKNDKEMWAFYTCPVSYSHRFERMIGMDRIKVINNELYCDCTDIPQTLDAEACEGLLPLTFYSLVSASSQAEGRDAVFAVDDSILSFWQPAAEDENPTLTVSLRGEYTVGACRIIRRCLNLDFNNQLLPLPLAYKVEVKNLHDEWVCILDCIVNTNASMIYYDETEPVAATEARLVLAPDDATVKNGIVSFTLFGKHK